MGYDNDEDALRCEFGSDMELDESDMAGGCTDSGGHSQREQQRDDGENLGALVGATQVREPVNMESQVEETNPEERENGFITTR